MRRLLKEPLLHFLLLGAGLFVAYSLLSRPGDRSAPNAIFVTAGRVEHLAAGFAKTWQRPPTELELKGLVDDWVREEIATREAMALGLDQDDTVIRRRLRQKLEFVSEDIAAQAEPTDADLEAYLQAHPDSFRVEPHFTFSQVYLNPDKHDGRLEQDAARLLEQLRSAGSKADISSLGDSLLIEQSFMDLPAGEITKQFGEPFAAALDRLAPGTWQGPIESGYGAHLVLVSARTAGGLPELSQVRDAVQREWANARRLETNASFYQRLLQRYTVAFETPAPAAGQASPKGPAAGR